MAKPIDILIPVYNEGENILSVLEALQRDVRTAFRVLILYDHDSDPTLSVIRKRRFSPMPIEFLKNKHTGVAGAIATGMQAVQGECAIVIPADDDYNVVKLDSMVALFNAGYEIVVPSRFMRGGCMIGCPWLKATLVRTAAFLLYYVARLPTHDATNGFRLFSKRVIETIPVESSVGFAYSIELLVKAHRLGWKIAELPVDWYERKKGNSRFRVGQWLWQYLRWFFYGFATTYLRRAADTVVIASTKGETVRSTSLSHTPQQST